MVITNNKGDAKFKKKIPKVQSDPWKDEVN